MIFREMNNMDSFTQEMNKNRLGKIFFLTLFLPLMSLVAVARLNDSTLVSEANANILSSLVALFCWVVAGWVLCAKIFGKRFFWILTVLILLKIFANFIHFYYVFAPLAGIDSSGALSNADYTGDLGVIFNSGVLFIEAYDRSGLLYAIFGDYYRGMNNPGVAIIYGGLFSVFGAYGTVAISWAVIYSAFTSLLIGLIGFFQKLPVNLCRIAMFLVFFMPGFFVFPPVYRDNFIFFLLSLSAYTAILMSQGNILLLSLAIFIESILLFSLRLVYLIIPPIFGIIAIYSNTKSRNKLMKHSIVFGFIVLVAIVVGWNSLSFYLTRFSGRFGSGLESELSNFAIMRPFKSMGPIFFYPAAAIFSLLAPMPWWQSVSPTLLAYQIFFYPQTWYSLTALIALFKSYKLGLMTREASTLVIFSLVIFLLALFGSLNFAAGYVQVALPFVILASIRYLSANWKKCFMISTTIIAFIHAALWAAK